jgi:hypothetical protein
LLRFDKNFFAASLRVEVSPLRLAHGGNSVEKRRPNCVRH